MARTTSPAVEAILGGHYDGETDLTAFIAAANALVDWVVSKDTTSELTSTMAERVECFLSCHFYAHSDQVAQSKSVGGSSDSYQGQTGMVLSSTQYGQTAMLLDVTGLLAKRSKEAETGLRRKVGVAWLGLVPDDQTDYEDRV